MKTKKEIILEGDAKSKELLTIMNNVVKNIKRTDVSKVVLTSAPFPKKKILTY
jgi:hypothetical protein